MIMSEAEQIDMLDELSKEYSPDMQTSIRQKINVLLNLKQQLAEAEAHVDDIQMKISKLENTDLPSMLDEFGIDKTVFQDGLKISLNDTVYTRVNKPECEKGWLQLKECGRDGIIKPVISVVISQNEDRKAIADLMHMINNSIDSEKIELDFKYHAGQLSAVVNDMLDLGIELDQNVFKQSVKRSVKITQPKSFQSRSTKKAANTGANI